MNIAELFVNLGIKGSEKTVGALTDLRKGLNQTKEMSFEAKAALLGAMYALERLFAASGQRGTDLTNFNATLGVSAKTLQQYQYAARQAGVSNQEVEGTFRSLQSTMTKTLMGEGAPKGLARVAQLTGGMNAQDIKKFAEQPQLLIQKLQEYAKKETNTGLRNEVLKSFGVGEGMIAAFQRQAFRPDVLAQAPTYSEGQVAALDKSRAAWANVGNDIEMMTGKLNAKFGPQFATDIGKIVKEIGKLSDAFANLAQKTHLLDWMDKAFEGWTKLIGGLTSAIETLQEATSEDPKKREKGQQEIADNLPGGAISAEMSILSVFGDLAEKVFGKGKSTVTPEQQAQLERIWKQGAPESAGEVQRFNAAQRPRGAGPGLPPPSVPPRGLPQMSAARESPGLRVVPQGPGVMPRSPGLPLQRPTEAPQRAGDAARPAPSLRVVVPPSPLMPTPKSIAPPMPAAVGSGETKQDISVNQTLNFQHPGTDSKKTGTDVKHAVQSAFRQMAAQGQGS